MEPDAQPSLRLVKGDTQPVTVIDESLAEPDFDDIDELALGPGLRIPNTPYRIDQKIGEGGMGDVFLATHVEIDRRVALKVLALHHCLDRHCVDTFRNEARASARIGAPNIVDIYDIYELRDGRVVLCMELVEGVALDDILDDDELDLSRLLGVTRQLCKGLAAAHAAGIVHRDIKPGNIMLSTRGEAPDFVKLLDFGIAAVQNDDENRPVAGTPEYMAPETFRGERLTGAVDTYAVGCLLYEWACRRRPFEGDPKSVATAQVYETPPAVEEYATREVPAELVAVIDRCLAKDPAERFEDMDHLEAALIEVQLAAKCITAWDHLPLPRIELAARERLGAGLTQLRIGPQAAVPTRRYWLPAVALGLVALGSSITAVSLANTSHVSESLMAAALVVKMEQSFGPAPTVDPRPVEAASIAANTDSAASDDAGATSRRRATPGELAAVVGGSGEASTAAAALEPAPRRRKSKRQRIREARAREEKQLLAAHEANPTDLATVDALAAHYFRRHAYRSSAKFARMAVDGAPDDGRRWLKLGHAEYKLSRWNQAKNAYAKANSLGDPFAAEHIALVESKLSD